MLRENYNHPPAQAKKRPVRGAFKLVPLSQMNRQMSDSPANSKKLAAPT